MSEKTIIAFSGRKQSGKTSACNFLFGLTMHLQGLTPMSRVDETGKLFVEKDGAEIQLDITSLEASSVWNLVQKFSFADELKHICRTLFNFTEEQCNGTDEQKNSLTTIEWEDMPGITKTKVAKASNKFMTAREFMEYFGTEICRSINRKAWCDANKNNILNSVAFVCLNDDTRFPDEVETLQSIGGKVIRLTRSSETEAKHEAEKSLDKNVYDWSKFDAVIDNENMTIYECQEAIVEKLKEWGIIETENPG